MEKPVVHPELLADIAAFCAKSGMSKPEFGKLAMNDPCVIYDLEKGRELRRASEAKLRDTLNSLSASATE